MPPPKVAKLFARSAGVALIVAALVSLLPNPILGEEAYFVTNAAHSGLLALLGVMMVVFSFTGESVAAMGLYLGGMIFLGIAILGYQVVDQNSFGNIANLFGLIAFSRSDIWLDVGMAVLLFMGGRMNTSSRQIIRE